MATRLQPGLLWALLSFGFLVGKGSWALGSKDVEAFRTFLNTYEKQYPADEFEKRRTIFLQNKEFIDQWNANKTNQFQLAMNRFGDLTLEEFKQFLHAAPNDRKMRKGTIQTSWKRDLPTQWDWRTKGAVSKMQDQGQCGNSWVFADVDSIQSCHEIQTGQMVTLSVQQIMDCDSESGCNGGLFTSVFDYVISQGGIDAASCYPWNPSGGCHYDPSCCASNLTKYETIPSGSEDALQEATFQGPTAVGIDASHASFQFYSQGIYYEPSCSSSQLDHAMLNVGWGIQGTSEYWIVKNYWGEEWGMDGYIWMARNRQNNCGIATAAVLPQGCYSCSRL